MVKSFKSFDGTSIYYEVTGSDHKKHPLIFLHGLGGDLTAWNEERKSLYKDGFSSVAVDLRGHGFSDRPRTESGYNLKNFAEDLRLLIKKEGIKKPVIVGHCFGGIIALTFAGLYPDIASALILVDTTYKSPFLSHLFLVNKPLHMVLRLADKFAPGYHFTGHNDYRRFINTSDYNLVRVASDISMVSMRSYIMLFDKFMDFDATTWLSRINIPTLIVEGADDSVFPPDVARAIHKRIIKSHIHLIKNANHILLVNNPKDLTKTILKFITRVI